MSEIIRIPSVGDLIAGKYRLTSEAGRGGFGVVFKATQEGINRQVAVKMLLPHAMSHEGVVERFKREAHLAGSLTHPNTVKIYDSGVHQPESNVKPLPYIVMEYLEGETLQSYLHRHRRLTEEDAFDILIQTLGSLAEAHRKGIIHRDLKPENIFICNKQVESRVIKVLDFGIAKAVDGDWDPQARERLTRTGFVAGTAEYMAPEQASGDKDPTPALDVYAMGCLAFQLFAGKVPYTGNSPMDIAIKHISDPIPRLPPPHQGQFIEQAVRKAMAKKPEKRFKDAREFAEILRRGTLGDSDVDLLINDDLPSIEDYDDGGMPTQVMASVLIDDDEYGQQPATPLPPVAAQPAASKTSTRVLIAAGVGLLFLLVTGLGVGIAGFNYFIGGGAQANRPAEGNVALRADKPENDQPSQKPEDDKPSQKPEGDDPDKGEGAQANQGDPKDPEENPKDAPPVEKLLASRALVTSSPSKAAVFRADDPKTKLGETPFELERQEGEERVELVIKYRRKTSELSVDWTTIDDGDEINANFRARNAGRNERPQHTASKGNDKPGDNNTANKGNDKPITKNGGDKGGNKPNNTSPAGPGLWGPKGN